LLVIEVNTDKHKEIAEQKERNSRAEQSRAEQSRAEQSRAEDRGSVGELGKPSQKPSGRSCRRTMAEKAHQLLIGWHPDSPGSSRSEVPRNLFYP